MTFAQIGRALLALLALLFAAGAPAADSGGFWALPRHGANSFNGSPPDESYFRALVATGASWVRIAPDKWKGERRDFLIGDADGYGRLAAGDLATLKTVVARAHAAGLGVVVAPLSLPGARWAQNNGGKFDDRLWSDPRWSEQAARFWGDLAAALKDVPGIAAYNIVNEPAPEKRGSLPEHPSPAAAAEWGRKVAGTPRDLRSFYLRVIAAIRAQDPATPIMVDAGQYASADGFETWADRLPEDNILYAVHMYEPWEVTSRPNLHRTPRLDYPGDAPFGGRIERWDAARIASHLARPAAWARAHGVPTGHLVLAEFGCIRRFAFCPRYLDDVLTAADAAGMHWAFYSFREDAWDAMDYELGPGPPPPGYWEDPVHARRGPNPVWEPIARRLAASSTSNKKSLEPPR